MSRLRILTLVIILLNLTGCATITNFFSPEYPYTYAIKGVDADEAMNKAERVALQMGLYVSRLDKEHGEMNAQRRIGAGRIEDTSLSFVLSKEKSGQLYFTLYIDTTSNDEEKIINEFVEGYKRYVKIIPPRRKETGKR